MNRLPHDIIHRILEYDGRIKYRNGEYMNQISQEDERYQILKQIPNISPEWSSSIMYMILLENSIFYTKIIDVTYTCENPLIEIQKGDVSSYYGYTKDEISYCWTIFHNDDK